MRKYSQYVDIEKGVAYLADSSYSGDCKVSLVELSDRLKYVVNRGYPKHIILLSK
ncbi:MAG TPA: hypothetical protein VGC02_00060 [Methanobacterium sp.]